MSDAYSEPSGFSPSDNDTDPLGRHSSGGDPLERIQARLRLEEINHFLLHDEGEIMAVPGKISLVWTDPIYDTRRFLAVKAAGEDQIFVNGRRFAATEAGLKQGLVACLADLR